MREETKVEVRDGEGVGGGGATPNIAPKQDPDMDKFGVKQKVQPTNSNTHRDSHRDSPIKTMRHKRVMRDEKNRERGSIDQG